MNKYVILITLNTPLALYGLFSVILSYKLKKLRPAQAAIRIVFWSFILAGIWFVKPVTDWLYSRALTNSPPLSIFDVLLITGTMVSLLLIARAHGRIAELESRFTLLHEKLALILSEPKPVKRRRAAKRH